MSNRLTVDMHVEHINTTESIDHVITYILAMPQWAKVSLATLLSTLYCYFASDDQKRICYCTHCRKLKCIHYYSCNFRFFTFNYKSGSICKTITTYYAWRFICWYTYYIFLDNKYSHTISWRESFAKLIRYTTYVGYWAVWAILNTLFESDKYAYILILEHIYSLDVGSPHHIRSYFWWGGGEERNWTIT